MKTKTMKTWEVSYTPRKRGTGYDLAFRVVASDSADAKRQAALLAGAQVAGLKLGRVLEVRT